MENPHLKFMLLVKYITLSISMLLMAAGNLSGQDLSFLSDSTHYIWPTDASPYLSSTFAETRSAHLHSGIDIRTWGREGYKVFASRDGHVYRISIGPSGYGKVIYLKHSDGSFTVYAHLNRFESNLQSYADSIRLQDYSFELDHYPADSLIYFNQGEVIGYSGSTGVGPPHLHFEVRNPEYIPVNPLLTNLKVDDDLPPVFTRIGIEFLNPQTLKPEDFKLLSLSGQNSGTNIPKISTNRPIGISVNVHDRANRTPNFYAVHSLTLTHEADTLFHSVADHFSFFQAQQMFLDRSYPILAKTRAGFQRLYVVNGNQLPFYKNVSNRGVLAFEEGQYPLTISARDIYGNEVSAEINIQFERNVTQKNIDSVPVYPSNGKNAYQHESSASIANTPLFAANDPRMGFMGTHRRTTSGQTTRQLLEPNQYISFEDDTRKVWIQFHESALYDTLNLEMEIKEIDGVTEFNFSPHRLPIQNSIQFNYLLPSSLKDKSNLGLFSYDTYRDRLTFLNSTLSGNIIRAQLKEIADLRIIEDNIAPWVGRPRITKSLSGKYIIELPVNDNLTKIDYRASTIKVNGEKGIIEYDPEDKLLIYYHPDFYPKDVNEVQFSVYDGVGNHTERQSTIHFTP